jgi:hypothetical protein
MTALMTYAPESVARVVADLRADARDRVSPSPAQWERLSGVVVRDRAGRYWTVGVRTGTWFRHAQGQWSPAAAPDHRVEGPLWIRDSAPVTDDDLGDTSLLDADGAPAVGTGPADPASIADIARDIWGDFASGLYSSIDATELLQQYYVADTEGVMHAPGCRSGVWYGWLGSRWQAEPAPPSASALVSRKDAPRRAAETLHAIGAMLAAGTPLPEPVADEWQPPPGVPERVVLCGACGAMNDSGAERCDRCRHPAAEFVDDPAKVVYTIPRRPRSRARTCPSCSATAAPDLKFCTRCGTRLD